MWRAREKYTFSHTAAAPLARNNGRAADLNYTPPSRFLLLHDLLTQQQSRAGPSADKILLLETRKSTYNIKGPPVCSLGRRLSIPFTSLLVKNKSAARGAAAAAAHA